MKRPGREHRRRHGFAIAGRRDPSGYAARLAAAASILIGTAGPGLALQPALPAGGPQDARALRVAQAPVIAPQMLSAEEQRERRELRSAKRKEWWGHAREVLFSGIELSPKQSRLVDALIEEQLWSRSREEEIAASLRNADPQADAEQLAALRAEQRRLREERTSRQDLYEQMRAMLSEAQRPAFDMNRARLVAEHQGEESAPQQEPLSDPRSPPS